MKLSIKAKGISVFKKSKATFSEMNQALKAVGGIIPAIAALMLFSNNALAVDLMASGKETVSDTFGANSAIATWIIIAEVILGVIGYMRTKNMLLLFGVAVVIVFTTIGFGLAA